MECYQHQATAAVGFCQSCNLGLCQPCATRFTFPICSSCAIKTNKATINRHISFMVGLLVFYVLMCIVIGSMSNVILGIILALPLTYLAASLIYGWTIVSNIVNRFFEGWFCFGTLYFWAVMLLIKAAISTAIGIFAAPFLIFRSIRDIKALRSEIQAIEMVPILKQQMIP